MSCRKCAWSVEWENTGGNQLKTSYWYLRICIPVAFRRVGRRTRRSTRVSRAEVPLNTNSGSLVAIVAISSRGDCETSCATFCDRCEPYYKPVQNWSWCTILGNSLYQQYFRTKYPSFVTLTISERFRVDEMCKGWSCFSFRRSLITNPQCIRSLDTDRSLEPIFAKLSRLMSVPARVNHTVFGKNRPNRTINGRFSEKCQFLCHRPGLIENWSNVK